MVTTFSGKTDHLGSLSTTFAVPADLTTNPTLNEAFLVAGGSTRDYLKTSGELFTVIVEPGTAFGGGFRIRY